MNADLEKKQQALKDAQNSLDKLLDDPWRDNLIHQITGWKMEISKKIKEIETALDKYTKEVSKSNATNSPNNKKIPLKTKKANDAIKQGRLRLKALSAIIEQLSASDVEELSNKVAQMSTPGKCQLDTSAAPEE
ncbi:hypothetical protein Q1695_012361 [Nippostrongylus brasiliensis]|nr:hypothetical protein Q1695_012361 [Nippostrongylus brasiliensis]